MPTHTTNGYAEHWKSSGEKLFSFLFYFRTINFIIKSYSYFSGKLTVFRL